MALLLPIYAHWRLPPLAENRWSRWLTGGFLVLLGVGVGWATAFRYFPMVDGAERWALFLIGFGVAHFPAAAVLFLKHREHRERRR
ncbi:hypothetical protein [Marinimicrobium agarilyticum]|uniref:hypothetical protein n=1 Tax=Marinimicrobium agarilyticum TaxID=306546 RepID=UPI0003FA4B89|nr:hypothetical protein [Marinimicrobium agarilyticum]